MFEQVLVDLLNRVLGDFVSNLETNQLNLGIWKGDVVLKNLRLRKDALDRFDLPIRIHEGYLGELKMIVPWQNLKNKPVRIEINDVYLLACPISSKEDWSEKEETEKRLRFKRERLENTRLLEEQQRIAASNSTNSPSSSSFIEKLATKIVDNLQFSIKRIHLRYEDDKHSNPNSFFSVGLTVAELFAVSTNEDWVEMFIQESRRFIYKMMRLESLSLYFNTGPNARTVIRQNVEDTIEAFRSTIPSNESDYDPSRFQFILKPISGIAKLIVSVLTLPDKPKVAAKVEFDEFALTLDDEQFRDMNYLEAFMKRLSCARRYASFRPSHSLPIRQNPRLYWQFAIRSIRNEIHEKRSQWTWRHIAANAVLRKQYAGLWADKRLGKLSETAKTKLEKMEEELEFEQIVLFRSVADLRLRRELPQLMASAKATTTSPKTISNSGWYTWWYGTDSSNSSLEGTPGAVGGLTADQYKQLYDAIGYQESVDHSSTESLAAQDESRVAYRFNFELKSGSFSLVRNPYDQPKKLVDFQYYLLSADYDHRLRGFDFAFALMELYLVDGVTQNTLYPVLIRAKSHKSSISSESMREIKNSIHKSEESLQSSSSQFLNSAENAAEPFFSLAYRLHPPQSDADYGLRLNMKPLEIVYSKRCIDGIRRFFEPPIHDSSLDLLKSIASQSLSSGFQGMTRAGLKFAIEEHKTMDLSVDIEAPIFIFPENPSDPSTSIILADLGHLSIASEVVSRAQRHQVEKDVQSVAIEKLESMVYDKFNARLTCLQLSIGSSAKELLLKSYQSNPDDEHFVIPLTDLDMQLQLCILPPSTDAIRVKVNGKLPSLQINFSDEKYSVLIRQLGAIFSGASSPDAVAGENMSNSTTSRKASAITLGSTTIDEFVDRKVLQMDLIAEKLRLRVGKTTLGNLADFRLDEISLAILLTSSATTCDLKVSNICLFDTTLSSQSSSYSTLLQYRKLQTVQNAAAKVRIIMAERNSPLYTTKFGGKDIKINVQFGAVDSVLNKDWVAEMYVLLMDLFGSKSSPPENSVAEMQQHSTSLTGGIAKVEPPSKSISLTFGFDALNVAVLLGKFQLFSTAYMEKSLIAIDLNPDETIAFTAKLGSIALVDEIKRRNNQIFRELIRSDAKGSCEIEYYSNRTENPECDSHLKVQAKSITITYLEDFLMELLDYVQDFSSVFSSSASSAASAQSAETSNEQYQSKAKPRNLYDIRLDSPIICLPSSLESENVVVFDLGSINIGNHLGADYTALQIDLRTKEIVTKLRENSQKMMEGFSVGIHIRQSDGVDETIPVTDIQVKVNDVNFYADDLQYTFALDIVDMMLCSPLLGGGGSQTPGVAKVSATKSLDKPFDQGRHSELAMKCHVEVSAVNLSLSTIGQKHAKQTGPMASAYLRKIIVDYSCHADKSSELLVSLEDLGISDKRGFTCYPDVFPPLGPGRQRISLEYSTNSAKDTILIASIDALETIISPEFFFSLRDFIVVGFGKSRMSGLKSAPTLRRSVSKQVLPQGNTAVQLNTEEIIQTSFTFRISITGATFYILQDACVADTDAMVLSINQFVVARESIFSFAINKLAFYLCTMSDRRQSCVQLIEQFDLVSIVDPRPDMPGQSKTVVTIDAPQQILLRVSYHDVLIVLDIISTISSEALKSSAGAPKAPTLETMQKSFYSVASFQESTAPGNRNSHAIEKCEFKSKGAKVLLIDDINNMHLPMFDFTIEPFEINLADWSGKMKFSSSISLFLSNFNVKNSHWEPLIEPWRCNVQMQKNVRDDFTEIELDSPAKLDVNITHDFLGSLFNILSQWEQQKNKQNGGRVRRIADAPYKIRNETGYNLAVWTARRLSDEAVSIASGQEMPWRFDDWQKMRQNINPESHQISLKFANNQWEPVVDIRVDAVGRKILNLNSRTSHAKHRLVCDIQLKGNMKIVTLRSGTRLFNCTKTPLEFILLDYSTGHQLPGTQVQTVNPDGIIHLPIINAFESRFAVRPASDFGYDWPAKSLFWKDLQTIKESSSVRCDIRDGMPFYLRLMIESCYQHVKNPNYPFMDIRIYPPFFVENILPHSLGFNLIDDLSKRRYSGWLKSGDIVPVHNVDLDRTLGLQIEVPDADYHSSELALVHSPSDISMEESVIKLKDSVGQELRLGIRKYNGNGPLSRSSPKTFAIFSPYIIVNKTELELSYRAQSFMIIERRAAGQGALQTQQRRGGARSEDNSAPPLMFSFSQAESIRGRVLVKGPNTEWSNAISLDGVGGGVSIRMKPHDGVERNGIILLNGRVSMGMGKYSLSKLVEIIPMYIVRNNLRNDEPLEIKLFGVEGLAVKIPSKQARPLLVVPEDEDSRMFCIRQSPTFEDWSPLVCFNNLGRIHVKLSNLRQLKERLLRLDIVIENSVQFITVTEEEGNWPFRIDNVSSSEIIIHQKNAKSKYRIKANQSMVYVWDEPSFQDKMMVVDVGGIEREVNILEIGTQRPLAFSRRGNDSTASSSIKLSPTSPNRLIIGMDVIAEGPTLVLKLTDWSEKDSIYRATRRKSTNGSGPQLKQQGSQELGFEVMDVSSKTLLYTHLHLKGGIGISLVNRDAKEILYSTFGNISLTYRDTTLFQTVGLIIRWIQIDNQLLSSFGPLILYPTIIPKAGAESEAHPALQTALVRTKDTSHGVAYYKYFTLLLQELSLELDEEYLFTLLDFFRISGSFDDFRIASDDAVLREMFSRKMAEPKIAESGDRMYFEVFQLQPAKINLTFSRSEQSMDTALARSNNPLLFLINIFTMAVGNITDAPIKLNALILEHPIFTSGLLMKLIAQHYGTEILGQLHRIVGSADVLGNPVGLFNTISSGVKDVFYEPYQGFVSDRPQDFGIGLAKGTASFLKKTVYGFSDTFSKFTGSLGKGLASATMDSEFQRNRLQAKKRNRPKHAGSGVTAGASSLARGIVSGITGIVEQPIKGAEKEGFGGFFKGIGKGIVGVVTKPVVGMFDMASNVSEGIRNTTQLDSDLDRVRLPRHVGKDGILRPFDSQEALGATILSEAGGKPYADEELINSIPLQHDHSMMLLLSNRRVLLVHSPRSRVQRQFKPYWSIELDRILSCSVSEDGKTIALTVNSDEAASNNSHDSANQTLTVRCENPAVAEKLRLAIVGAVANWQVQLNYGR